MPLPRAACPTPIPGQELRCNATLQAGEELECVCCVEENCSDTGPLLHYIPEPGGTLMLLVGFAAVLCLRKRAKETR